MAQFFYSNGGGNGIEEGGRAATDDARMEDCPSCGQHTLTRRDWEQNDCGSINLYWSETCPCGHDEGCPFRD